MQLLAIIDLHLLKEYLFGEASLTYYVAAEIFALMGLTVSLYLHSNKRNPDSPKTPEKYSLGFLIWDNFKRIFVGQMVFFLIFRFTVELLGRQLDMWIATGVGFGLSFGIDKAIQWIMSKNPGAAALMQTGARKIIEETKKE